MGRHTVGPEKPGKRDLSKGNDETNGVSLEKNFERKCKG